VHTVRQVEDDMMMSFGIADLRESRYGLPNFEARLQSPEPADDNPAESLYESAIEDETPACSPKMNPSRTACGSAMPPPRDIRNKIFGLRKSHIVIQMWKEPVAATQETASGGTSTAQARIAVDLGNLATVLTSEQVKSLFLVVGSFPTAQQVPRQHEGPIRPVDTSNRQALPPLCQLLVNRVDLHYLYELAAPSASQLHSFWENSKLEGVEENNLHLRLSDVQAIRADPDTSLISLASCALVDAYRPPGHGKSLRLQPIFLIGKASEPIWLPPEAEVTREATLDDAREQSDKTQVSLNLSVSGEPR
jgi:hypothetical protein